MTRNARIEAERRLLEYDTLVRHANLWCACLTATLSMLSVFLKSDCFAFVSAASAVVLTITLFYASSRSYAEKASRMKSCYTELQGLSIEASRILFSNEDNREDSMAELGQRYVEILSRTDNHSEKDYERALADKSLKTHDQIEASRGNPSEKVEKCKRRGHNISFYVGMVLVYVVPVAALGLLALIFQVVQ